MPEVYSKRKGAPKPPGYAVLIDRTTSLGNPYVIGRDGNREEVLQQFEAYARDRIRRDANFRATVRSLLVADLLCWCAPLPCHGNIYHKLAREIAEGTL